MPELPEIATMVKALKPHLAGRRVRHVVSEDEGLLTDASQAELRKTLANTVVSRVVRLGKCVRIDFEPPDRPFPDRTMKRPPAPAESVIASRPATLEALLSRARVFSKAGRSGPTHGPGARALFESTRLKPGKTGVRSSLVFHLRMTGRFFIMNDNGHPVPERTRFLLSLEDDEDDLLFGIKDTRRLGRIYLLTGEDAHQWPEWLELGPDAVTGRWTENRLARSLQGNLPIKLALLDQSRIAGIGNIYACEVLHRTGIHPERPAAAVTAREWAALNREIPRLLKQSMQEWCAISRWLGPAVEGYGDFNGNLRVYDREGEPCRRCGEPIETVRQGGRTTFYCAGCQK